MKDYFFGASKQKTVEQVHCPRCGENHIGYLNQRGPHIGLYCTGCDGWIKWLSAAEKKQINLERAQKDFEEPIYPVRSEQEDIVYDDREYDLPF